MIKKLFIFIFVSVMCMASYAQRNYSDWTNTFSVGIISGEMHEIHKIDGERTSDYVMGAYFEAYNVYFDAYGTLNDRPRYYRSYYDYDLDRSRKFACHVGYRVNLGPYIGVTPMVGYAQTSRRISDYRTSYYRRYDYAKKNICDFGARVDAFIPCSSALGIQIGGTWTRTSYVGSVGISVRF